MTGGSVTGGSVTGGSVTGGSVVGGWVEAGGVVVVGVAAGGAERVVDDEPPPPDPSARRPVPRGARRRGHGDPPDRRDRGDLRHRRAGSPAVRGCPSPAPRRRRRSARCAPPRARPCPSRRSGAAAGSPALPPSRRSPTPPTATLLPASAWAGALSEIRGALAAAGVAGSEAPKASAQASDRGAADDRERQREAESTPLDECSHALKGRPGALGNPENATSGPRGPLVGTADFFGGRLAQALLERVELGAHLGGERVAELGEVLLDLRQRLAEELLVDGQELLERGVGDLEPVGVQVVRASAAGRSRSRPPRLRRRSGGRPTRAPGCSRRTRARGTCRRRLCGTS